MQHAIGLTATTLRSSAALVGCAGTGTATAQAAVLPAPASAAGPVALALLITLSGQRSALAMLRTVDGGVEVAIDVAGMQPGAHGFHIQANGACAPGPDAGSGHTVDFGAAGGHFDPDAAHKHGRPGQAVHETHVGELPNLHVGADGRGVLRHGNANVSLSAGPVSVLGRALVPHADADADADDDDDASNPAGHPGTRVLCGVIALSLPAPQPAP